MSEGNRTQLRHRFARFHRRSAVVSKSQAMVDRTLALSVHHHSMAATAAQR